MKRSGRGEQPIPAPAAPEAEAAPRSEETQGMRLEREARDLAADLQRTRQLRTTRRDSRVVAILKTCETG